MVVALAFVPIAELDNAFHELSENLPDEYAAELQPVLDWFEDNYLGRPLNGGGRHRARFPSSMW
jgi:hypothetical protein